MSLQVLPHEESLFGLEEKNEGKIILMQDKLINGFEDEVLTDLKTLNIENWLELSEMFPKFIHCVVAMGYEKILVYLLELFPKKIETKNVIGSTLIYTAIEARQDNLTQILINKRANLLVINGRGNSLLHAISKRSGRDILTLMQKIINLQPSLLNVQNSYGETPLHLACLCGIIDNVELLLKNGAHTDIETRNGKTPSMYAIESVKSREIQVLINNYTPKITKIEEEKESFTQKITKSIKNTLQVKEIVKLEEDTKNVQPFQKEELKEIEEIESDHEFEDDISSIIEERICQIEEKKEEETNSNNKEEIKLGMSLKPQKIIKNVLYLGTQEYRERKLEILIQELCNLYPIDTLVTDTSLTYTPNQKYRILSLDGLSDNPILQIYILQKLVQKFPMFIAKCNVISGVGISAFIAGSIAKGLSLDFLEKVFPLIEKYTRISKKRRFNASTKYTNHYYDIACSSLFSNQTLSKFPRKFFTYYQQLSNSFVIAEGSERANEAIMKSCSLPFLFKPYCNCISGMIIQPNPSNYALMDALKTGIRKEDCVVLSLSNGFEHSEDGEGYSDFFLSDWFSSKEFQNFEGQIKQSSVFCSTILGDRFLRFSPMIHNTNEEDLKKIVQKMRFSKLEQWLSKEWFN
ncbi:ankyrin repeat-containing protein, putative [Entamoeba dispar SAW760]|uniref:phospholipase A2 n=1 Tax=Entamoeba dispar (strain ATCC PRA-260 / SAW760) TaxID=370354 RepID=B0EGP1_ENTDS|nr:ankyrin repeat-containing protein, putative [Entamoeba dispar SAW760]EDR26315.1 ankyrin repeat-containing protein, putative [Entamoeba dispar SAW760]|eukprot:EDR26315.1 ankyrin repeat-containing protein, putative [Entamoeba dispar SAW760]